LLGNPIIPPLRGFVPGLANPGVTLRYTPGYAHPAPAGLMTYFAEKWFS